MLLFIALLVILWLLGFQSFVVGLVALIVVGIVAFHILGWSLIAVMSALEWIKRQCKPLKKRLASSIRSVTS